MENFGKFMTVMLSLIILPVVKGFVFMKLFNWFAVPVFGIEQISFVLSIGIIYLMSLLLSKYEKTSKDFDWQDFGKRVAHGIIHPAFILLAGWIVSLMM